MNEQRAKRLIQRGIGMAVARGHLWAPPESGQYQIMLIELIDGGPRFRMQLAKLDAEQVSRFSKGQLTGADIERVMTRRDHFPLLAAVVDGDDLYSEVTELRVDVARVGQARPFQGGG